MICSVDHPPSAPAGPVAPTSEPFIFKDPVTSTSPLVFIDATTSLFEFLNSTKLGVAP